jgi:hypothetical protein
MEILASSLHGMYAWILTALILIVSSLSLTLLWLIVRRTQLAEQGGSVEAIPVPVSNNVVNINSAEVKTLRARVEELEQENAQMKQMKEDYENLQQKVKFLESKLLEYEILQEEIGTLSTLKVENEKLKKEIQQLQSEIEKSRKAPVNQPVAQPIPQPVAAPITEPIAEIVTAPVIEEPVAPVPAADFSNLNVEVEAPPEIPVAAEEPVAEIADMQMEPPPADFSLEIPPPEIQEATELVETQSSVDKALAELETELGVSATPESPTEDLPPPPALDGLLAEIDALTATAPKTSEMPDPDKEKA